MPGIPPARYRGRALAMWRFREGFGCWVLEVSHSLNCGTKASLAWPAHRAVFFSCSSCEWRASKAYSGPRMRPGGRRTGITVAGRRCPGCSPAEPRHRRSATAPEEDGGEVYIFCPSLMPTSQSRLCAERVAQYNRGAMWESYPLLSVGDQASDACVSSRLGGSPGYTQHCW